MKSYGTWILFVLFILTGCADHYYKVEKNALTMYLKAPEADKIFFASSADQFKLHRAVKINDDTWAVQAPLHQEFRYFYVVDGSLFLPACKLKEKDDFGSENCLFVMDM